MLSLALTTYNLAGLLDPNQKIEVREKYVVGRGILQLAKLRGFILALDKDVDLTSALFEPLFESEDEGVVVSVGEFVVGNCDKNEGL
jgi:hypothetical protein